MGKNGTKQETANTNWKEMKRTRQHKKEWGRTKQNEKDQKRERAKRETIGQNMKEQNEVRKKGNYG